MSYRNLLALSVAVLLPWGPALLAQTVNPSNPGIFQYFAAPVSSHLAFLASSQGGQVLLHSPAPNAKGLLTRFHPELVSLYPQKPFLKAPSSTLLTPTLIGCGSASGTQMNLEPATNAVPQNTESVDFIQTRLGTGTGNRDLVMETAHDSRGFMVFGGSTTGIYVHRDPTVACYAGPTTGTDFEMGNPPISNPLTPTDMVAGGGIARVVADKANDQFIVADLRLDQQVAGIGLRRIVAANLVNTTTCPAGTQTSAAAATCAGANAVIVSATDDEFVDFPGLAQDHRATGTGAGDIYVTNTAVDFVGFVTEIHLTACKKGFTSLSQCSPTITISGTDTATQFSSVSVVPAGPTSAGTITVVYSDFTFSSVTLRFVKCAPKGAPLAPVCSAPTTITTDANPLFSFSLFGGGLTGNAGLSVNTIPVHVDRADGTTGQTTFVVWADCKVATASLSQPCLDADIKMTTSTNLGTSWAAVTALDGTTGSHEFDPAITVDDGQNITKVAYYHTPDLLHFKNRTVVDLKQIPSGSITPGPVIAITSTPDSPEGDANFSSFAGGLGDYLGVGAHGTGAVGGSCAYIGHTNNTRLGIYSGLSNAESNNHVSKLCY